MLDPSGDLDTRTDARSRWDTSPLRFPFRFSLPFRLAGLPFGVTPERCVVLVGHDELRVRFGPWTFRAPLDTIESACVTGPYAWPKVIGPPHLSLADGGVTMATNTGPGVCIRFRDPVAALLPWGIVRHRGVTLTVSEPERLAELLGVAAGDTPVGSVDLVEDVHVALTNLTTKELRARARELGVQGASRLKKAELVEALAPVAAPDDDRSDTTSRR